MKNMKLFGLMLLGCISLSIVSCNGGGDGDNNGKEDNRTRKVWNENDRKQKYEEKNSQDSSANASDPVK
ncbi:MAG: hypothetical protein H0X46_06380 [Bacteroidetes bacterium]|nr:hypothetical protein [Bacteroidota bacterium]